MLEPAAGRSPGRERSLTVAAPGAVSGGGSSPSPACAQSTNPAGAVPGACLALWALGKDTQEGS